MNKTDRIKTGLPGKENRRGFLRKFGGLAALLALPGVGGAAGSPTLEGNFVHVVLSNLYISLMMNLMVYTRRKFPLTRDWNF